MKYNRPYRGLRSQRRKKRIRMVISLILLLNLLLMLCYFLLQDHIVFSADRLHVRWPWSDEEPKKDPPPGEDEVPLVVEGQEGDQPDTPDGQDDPDAPGQSLSQRSILLSAEQLTDRQQVERAIGWHQGGRIDSVVVELKTQDGLLTYQSQLERVAGTAAISSDAPAVSEQLQRLRQAGVPMIGLICACIDNQMPMIDRTTSVHVEEGVNWLDRDRNRHLDPTSPSAIAYLSELIEEAGALGVSEVVVAEWSYPTVGKLERAVYADSQMPKAQALESGWRQMMAAAQRGGVALSLLGDTQTAEESAVSGVDMSVLGPLAARQYVTQIDEGAVWTQRLIGQQIGGSEQFCWWRADGEYDALDQQ